MYELTLRQKCPGGDQYYLLFPPKNIHEVVVIPIEHYRVSAHQGLVRLTPRPKGTRNGIKYFEKERQKKGRKKKEKKKTTRQ